MTIFGLYETITRAISDETGASDSLLHVHAGMAVLLLARVVTGKSLATPIPFLVVCVAAVANEVIDRINHGIWRPLDTGLDLLNTLFWPFVLMVGLRIRRSLDARKAGERN
ncbi:MAG: hypothetical protein ACR2JJ_02305 [Sphingomicrobium sp.]